MSISDKLISNAKSTGSRSDKIRGVLPGREKFFETIIDRTGSGALKKTLTCCVFSPLLFLTACGGGGSSPSPVANPDLSAINKAQIKGEVYADTNGNSVKDDGESGLANVKILVTEGNNTSFTLTSNADGIYSGSVNFGDTIFDIDESTLPTGSVLTEGANPSTVNLQVGSVNAGIDGFFVPKSVISGSVSGQKVSGAQVSLYQVDSNGDLLEIVAVNAPVVTATDGSFEMENYGAFFAQDVGPLIIKTNGGSLNGQPAPVFSTLVVDGSTLVTDGANLQVSMSSASSVAAGLAEALASTSGEKLSQQQADDIISQVESELNVDLSEDALPETNGISFLEAGMASNLDLLTNPENTPAISDWIEYLVLNLGSSSGLLDGSMRDPITGLDVAASFSGLTSGELAALLPTGPSAFLFLTSSFDKTTIENSGLDVAKLNVTISDATGVSAVDGTEIEITKSTGGLLTFGRAFLPDEILLSSAGRASADISSLASGEDELTVSVTLPLGNLLSNSLPLTTVDEVADDELSPRVVSAGSTNNTEILLTFSEPMRGGIERAENPEHYRIVGESILPNAKAGAAGNVISEKPTLLVTKAELIRPELQTVRLTTLSQSDLEYQISVFNVTDMAGNTMAPREVFVGSEDPSTATFQGTAPSGLDIVDSDGDGLSDSDEQRGWIVSSVSATGVVQTYEVTSDPFNADTDGDGVTDNEEFQGGLSPRTEDTDGDTLSDDLEWNTIFSDGTNQDSDGDGVQDGFEYYTFRTSPILVDTDGDGLTDPEEVSAGNRNPLVADIPIPRITIGGVNMVLDTRFTYTTETGEEVAEVVATETTLVKSENDSFSTSNEESTKATLEASQELEVSYGGGILPPPGFSGKATAGSTQGSERGNTFTTNKASGTASEQAYNDSLTSSVSRDIRETITRDVVGAKITLDVSVENVGSLPFTISNLEISAQTQDPRDRRRVIPIASLVPQGADDLEINIGSLGSTVRGPFVFEASNVFPSEIEQLMKSPRGLITKLANFDITDELGRNFAFGSLDIVNRTAGISFDLGDGRVETYRVATASAHNRSNGEPLGIPMSYALEVIGLNSADYETQAKGGDGATILTRFRDVGVQEDDPATPGLNEAKRFWAMFSSKDLDQSLDFEDIILRAGDQFNFTFVQDQDDDGVWAREENLHGSSDLNPNTDGDLLTDAEEIQDGWLIQTRGLRATAVNSVFSDPTDEDSDEDGLTDAQERACGLDPRQKDSDQDGLSDYDEIFGTGPLAGVTRYIGTSPNADEIQHTTLMPLDSNATAKFGACDPTDFATDPLNPDTDGDMINDSAEIELGINPNLRSDGGDFLDADGDGIPNNVEETGFAAVVNGVSVTFTSDPLIADTDGDGLFDLLEFFLKSNPQAADTDGDGLRDNQEYSGPNTCITKQRNRVSFCEEFDERSIQSYSDYVQDCNLSSTCVVTEPSNVATTTNLNERDSDFDTLWDKDEIDGPPGGITVNGTVGIQVTSDPRDANEDGDGWDDDVERAQGTNPRAPDTDADGTRDHEEAVLGRSPVQPDRLVVVNYTAITFSMVGCDNDGFETDPEDYRWEMGYKRPGTTIVTYPWRQTTDFSKDTDENGEIVEISLGAESDNRFVANIGDSFAMVGTLEEWDDEADENFVWDDTYPVDLTTTGPQEVDKQKTAFCDDDDEVIIKATYELK